MRRHRGGLRSGHSSTSLKPVAASKSSERHLAHAHAFIRLAIARPRNATVAPTHLPRRTPLASHYHPLTVGRQLALVDGQHASLSGVILRCYGVLVGLNAVLSRCASASLPSFRTAASATLAFKTGAWVRRERFDIWGSSCDGRKIAQRARVSTYLSCSECRGATSDRNSPCWTQWPSRPQSL